MNPCRENISITLRMARRERVINDRQTELDKLREEQVEDKRSLTHNEGIRPRIACTPILVDELDVVSGLPTSRQVWQHEAHCELAGEELN